MSYTTLLFPSGASGGALKARVVSASVTVTPAAKKYHTICTIGRATGRCN